MEHKELCYPPQPPTVQLPAAIKAKIALRKWGSTAVASVKSNSSPPFRMWFFTWKQQKEVPLPGVKLLLERRDSFIPSFSPAWSSMDVSGFLWACVILWDRPRLYTLQFQKWKLCSLFFFFLRVIAMYHLKKCIHSWGIAKISGKLLTVILRRLLFYRSQTRFLLFMPI